MSTQHFHPPPSSELLFPVALIKDFIVTDCSCEGFSNAVKAGQLAGWGGGSFCLCFSPEAADRQTDRQTVQELVSSCLVSASSFIRLRLLRSSQDLPPRRRREPGKKGHSERLEARRRACATEKNKPKKTLSLCADLHLKAPPSRCSRKITGSARSSSVGTSRNRQS